MPIEFACEECQAVLRVPDGSSGKRSRCPACQHEQQIPYMVSAAIESAESPSELAGGASGSSAAGSEDGSQLSIPCPKCRHHLVCSPELLGTRGQCKQCAHIFTIATEPTAVDDRAPSLVFHCPECQQLFEGREEMRSRKGKCHVCQAVFFIELKPAGHSASAQPRPAPSQPAAPAGSSKLPVPHSAPKPVSKPVTKPASQPAAPVAPVRPATAAKPQRPIRFTCTHCQGVMEVPGSTAGLQTECPYCQVAQTIPAQSNVPLELPPAPSYTPPAPAPSPRSQSAPLHSAPQGGSGGYAAQPQAAADDLFSDLGSPMTNPYAPTATAGQWAIPTGSGAVVRRGLSIGNALSLGFESLFPSCLTIYVSVLILALVGWLMGIALGSFLETLRPMEASRGTKIAFLMTGMGVYLFFSVLVSAWFIGSVSNMALRAVRKRTFKFGESLNPGNAYGTACLIGAGHTLLGLVANIPLFLRIWDPSLPPMAPAQVLPLTLCVLVAMFLFVTITSLACFGALDGEGPVDSLASSAGRVFRNLPTMLVVKTVIWAITILAIVPTLGLAATFPFYMNAALYQLAKSEE
ncbi:MAG: hypothetical protein IT423_15495 [Pirellulaceae bacterium]|nr:hypothetical protein [Pirellulaceae bacterium]